MADLISNVRHLRTRLMRIALLRGVTIWLALWLSVFAILGWLDWSIRFEWLVPRWGISLLLWSVAVVGFYRFIWRPWRRRPSLVDVALWVEQSDRSWSGELAAAVAFSQNRSTDRETLPPAASPQVQAHSSELPLSTALRESVIRRVRERLAEEELRRRASGRSLLAWGSVLAILLCVSAATGTAFPEETSLATTRLLYPDSELSWPQRTRLELLDTDFQPLPIDRPVMFDRQGPLEILVHDQIPPGPSTVELEVRRTGEAASRTILTPVTRRTPQGEARDVFVATLNPAREETIRVRAVADDDRYPAWVTIVRRTPPALTRLSLTVHLPAGLNADPQRIDNVAGPVSVIAGSQVLLDGILDRPVAAVRVLPDTGDDLSEFPVDLYEPNRFRLILPISDTHRGPLRVSIFADLSSEATLSSPSSRPIRFLEFTVLPDEPPRVQLITPDGHIRVTPQAVLPVEAVARDDFGLSRLEIVALLGDSVRHFDAAVDQRSPREWQVAEDLVIADWLPLLTADAPPADPVAEAKRQVRLMAVADDHNPRTEPQTSSSVTVSIVSVAEKQQEWETQLRNSAEELAALLEAQRQVQQQTQLLRQRHAQAGTLSASEALQIKQAAQAQGAIADRLTHADQGVQPLFRHLRWEIELNRLTDLPLLGIVRTVTEEVDELTHVSLPRSRESLTALDRLGISRGIVRSSSSEQHAPEQLFAQTVAAQQQSVARLETLLHLLGEWHEQSSHAEEWQGILVAFREMKQQTIDVGRETISRSPDDLTPDQRRSLSHVEEQHRQLSSRVSQFLLGVRQRTGFVSDSGFSRISAELERSTVAERLNLAAQELARNQVPQAIELDRQVKEALERAERSRLGVPGAAPVVSLEDHLQLVRQALDWIAETSALQQEISDRFLDLLRRSTTPEKVEQLQTTLEQQSALADAATDWTTRFRYADLSAAAHGFSGVGREMRELEQQVHRQHGPAVGTHTRRILAGLNQLDVELSDAYERLLLAVDSHRIQELGERGRGLAERQDRLADETSGWKSALVEMERPTRALRGQIHRASGEQRQLVEEVDGMLLEAAHSPIVTFALHQIRSRMDAAAGLLERAQVTDHLLQQQRDASDLLRDLFAATQGAAPAPSSAQPPGEEHPQSTPAPRQRSELVLLIQLQERLTARADALLANGSTEFSEELQRLAAEQEELTRLIRQFLDETAAP